MKHTACPARCVAAVVILATCGLPAWAQSTRLTLTGGLTRSRIAFDTLAEIQERPDWAANVGLDFDLSRTLGLRVEAMVANKGFGSERGGGVAIRYFELPVLVRYRAVSEFGVVPSLAFGIAPAWQTNCESQRAVFSSSAIGTGWTRSSVPCSTHALDGMDLGIIAAAGIGAARGRVRWTADLRYTHGTRNLSTAPQYGERKNRSLALLIGAAVMLSGNAWRPPQVQASE